MTANLPTDQARWAERPVGRQLHWARTWGKLSRMQKPLFDPFARVDLHDNASVIWSGRPHRGWFVRPIDIPNTIVITLASVFVVYHRFWLELAPILTIALMGLIGYLLVGRFIHDAAAREQIMYQLTACELRVISLSSKSIVRTIPVEQLLDVEPSWPGFTASIILPQRPGDVVAALTNGWDQLVPAANPSRRLELIDDAPKIAALIRHTARARNGRRCD